MLEQVFVLVHQFLGSELDILVEEIHFGELSLVVALICRLWHTNKLIQTRECSLLGRGF
jgi:hypothetical protein